MTGLFTLTALVLPYVGGFPLAYLLMILGIAMSIAALVVPRRSLPVGRGELMAVVSAILLMVPLVLTGDLIPLLNFSFLFAAVPVSMWLGRYARPGNSVTVAWLALAGSTVAAVTALYQVGVLGMARASGVNSDPIWSADAALLLGFLSMIGIVVGPPGRRLIFLLGPMLGVAVVLLSGSRGPMLAVPVLMLALARPLWRWWRELAGATLIAALMAGLIVLLFPTAASRVINSGAILTDVVTIGAVQESSANSRLAFWQAGLAAFLERPLTGHGWSHRISAVYGHLPEHGAALERNDPQLVGNRHLHADILNIGVGNGVLGLIGYGLLLGFPLLSAWQSPADSQRPARLVGATVLSLSTATFGLTYIMIGYEFHTTLFVAIAAIVTGFCRDGREETPAAAPAA